VADVWVTVWNAIRRVICFMTTQTDISVIAANELLCASPIAAVRLAAWDPQHDAARFDVFHIEWPNIVFGTLIFSGVEYVQVLIRTSWGYRMRLSPDAALPSRSGDGSNASVFELFTPDGSELSVYIVAERLAVQNALPG
jgi:hypothetical protein